MEDRGAPQEYRCLAQAVQGLARDARDRVGRHGRVPDLISVFIEDLFESLILLNTEIEPQRHRLGFSRGGPLNRFVNACIDPIRRSFCGSSPILHPAACCRRWHLGRPAIACRRFGRPARPRDIGSTAGRRDNRQQSPACRSPPLFSARGRLGLVARLQDEISLSYCTSSPSRVRKTRRWRGRDSNPRSPRDGLRCRDCVLSALWRFPFCQRGPTFLWLQRPSFSF